MGKFGQVRAILDKFRQVWASLGKFGHVWTSFDKLGQGKIKMKHKLSGEKNFDKEKIEKTRPVSKMEKFVPKTGKGIL